LARDVGDFIEIEDCKLGEFIEKCKAPRVSGNSHKRVSLFCFFAGGNFGGNEVISHDVFDFCHPNDA
jgi:hypothetical protein